MRKTKGDKKKSTSPKRLYFIGMNWKGFREEIPCPNTECSKRVCLKNRGECSGEEGRYFVPPPASALIGISSMVLKTI